MFDAAGCCSSLPKWRSGFWTMRQTVALQDSVYTSAGPYLSLTPLLALLDFGVVEKSPVE